MPPDPVNPAAAVPRRDFVRVAATVVASLATGRAVTGCAKRPALDAAVLRAPALLAVLDRPTVRAIGAAYLAGRGAERTVPALEAAIAADVRDWRGDSRRALEALIAQDFARARVVHPDGWILALTEARQCALVALAPA